ncbi:FtsH protease activity modulator HflK [Pseudoxanthomonas sangjuensis]|uniref:FtsH protease activity modulator HflK n=1 Tax=Pseudoxanthomonas sangjuensis TaxID=1503750 RepID=UPI001390C663|nr:FtsH protease activity modulator HflK [Pseudoxanthomonas sangjuensis]KAF1713496.1 FtsH protease activity modulator HflK [Pseudoxanthomonas sangjuensis]
MAWNTPGSGSGGNDNKRNPWQPRGGGSPFDNLLARLRGLFEGGNGGWWRWAGVVLGLLVLFSSFKLIGEQERGVVLRFGQFNRIMQPGPNFKWPWPIESMRKVNATEIKGINKVVPVLTSDENIVSVTLNVQYRVSDPRLYFYGTRDPAQVLEQAAQSAVREQVGRSDLEDVLNKRGPLASSAKERLQHALDAYRTGLTVTGLTLPNARPPDEVKPAFDEVNGAQQVKERLVNEAQAYAAQVVPEARGTAARRRAEAEGYKASVVAKAQGDASRYSQLYEQYKSAPEVTRKRLWLETVQRVLAQNRKVVGGDGRQLIYVPMPAQSGAATAAPVLPTTPELTMPAVESSATERDSSRPPRPTGREEVQR